jgi:hypothetical protein
MQQQQAQTALRQQLLQSASKFYQDLSVPQAETPAAAP